MISDPKRATYSSTLRPAADRRAVVAPALLVGDAEAARHEPDDDEQRQDEEGAAASGMPKIRPKLAEVAEQHPGLEEPVATD